MTKHKVVSAVMVTVVLATVSTTMAEDKKKDPQPDPKQLQKLAEECAKPGKAHKHLKRLAGRWDTLSKTFFPNPEKPTITKGSSNIRSLMGGRYIQQKFRGVFNGKNFQGMGVTGFDNAKKKFVGIWIDSEGTGIMQSEGTYDAKTQTLTENATSSSPMGPMKMRMVTKYLSDDKFVFTMFMLAGGGEQKIMEMTYTRSAGGRKSKKKDKK